MVGIPWDNKLDPKWKKLWPSVRDKLEQRMVAGHQEYSDRSFSRPVFELLNETEEELMDQMVWSFIAITRLNTLRERIQTVEQSIDQGTGPWLSQEEINEWMRKAR